MLIKTPRKRINVTLPEDTIHLIDRVAKKGDRSRFLNEAVHYYIKETGRAKLQRLLKEGAMKRAERDLRITQEWFPLDQEAWQRRNNA